MVPSECYVVKTQGLECPLGHLWWSPLVVTCGRIIPRLCLASTECQEAPAAANHGVPPSGPSVPSGSCPQAPTMEGSPEPWDLFFFSFSRILCSWN